MVKHTNPADTHTHTHTHTHIHTHPEQQDKQYSDWLYGKEHSIQWRLLTSPCSSCALVCLFQAIKLLNHENDWFKYGEKFLINLKAHGRLNFQFQTLSNNKMDGMRIFELWATLLTLYIVCAIWSWTNVKNYCVYIVMECEIGRWRTCVCLVKFPATMTMDDWEQAWEFWYGGKLCTCLHIIYKILILKMYMWICEFLLYRRQV